MKVYCLARSERMANSLTLEEKLLLVGIELEQNRRSPFSAEDLVIAAWKKFPEAFGLEGYPDHPDSNRILTRIMGKKGLRGRGWLLKVGEKRYQLTEAGRIASRALLARDQEDTSVRASLSRVQKHLLRRLLESKAVKKYRLGEAGDIIFHDACAFWEISPRSVANTLKANIATIEAVITAAEKAIREGQGSGMTHGGAGLTQEDLKALTATHEFMLEKFTSELSIIRQRLDERRVG
jgi:hypothetical protein